MYKNTLSRISWFLVIIMIMSTLSACGNGFDVTESKAPDVTEEETTAPGVESSEEGSKSDESQSEGTTEKNTEVITKPIDELVGPYAEVIENAHKLANGVQDYSSVNTKGAYYIENQNMSLEYLLSSAEGKQLAYLKNTQGKSYIENTLDVFVKMTDGSTYYASKSSKNGGTNVYKFGYYYSEVRFEGQDFINGSNLLNELDIPLDVEYSNQMAVKRTEGALRLIVSNSADPYISFSPSSYSTDTYKYIQFTIKNSVPGASATVYVIAGSETTYGSQFVSFSLHSDGEYHTYDVYLGNVEDYTGDISKIRLDLSGLNKSEYVELSAVKLFDADPIGVSTLSTARVFHAYSDKLHHELQVSASENTENIAEIGMITRIASDTVDKIIIKDANGKHDTLDGVDWDSAEYIGFDIKEAGIFGYILPVDDTTGKMTVTLEDGYYVITQSRAPENNTVLAGDDQKIGNTNDFYMGQRLYTDENHTFDAFITEAEIERNPLTAKNIKISTGYSETGAYFVGYDAIRGSYELFLPGPSQNGHYYYYPNRHFELNFTVRGDKYQRNIYILASTDHQMLECAVVLDEDLTVLPIPVEVGKNFFGDGDANIYDLLDICYGEAIFPIPASSSDTLEFNVIHLYQNWGNYPLKQVSFIEWYYPYYHLSTGLVETNCINLFSSSIQNFLPDHRTMSAPFWPSGAQHNSSGWHTVFDYKSDDGNSVYTDITEKFIDSYGPTYSEVKMNFLSNDGKVLATYTNIEMPQTDENRGYYIMEYEFLEDISFKSFRESFNFYTVTDNDSKGVYQLFGYLNENNEPTIADANIEGPEKTYVLGTEAPYFDYCYMVGAEGNGGFGGWYGNVSFLICSSEIIANGEKITPNFAVREGNLKASLTLDVEEISFKAGDKITINAIIMPWGSQELDYSGKDRAPDQNVRDVRENTILNPVKLTAGENVQVIDSTFVPKIKTTNGKSAEFTISGGENNIAIRAYGFYDLSIPKVYEKINGEWVEYKLNSAGSPDAYGYHSYYDGYTTYYDGDYTYSYSFVVTMTDGAPRTFRIETEDDFKGWPRIEIEEVLDDKLPVYIDHLEIAGFTNVGMGCTFYVSGAIKSEGTLQFVRLTPKIVGAQYDESYDHYYNYDPENPAVSGQYLVIKYRTNAIENPFIEIYSSTQNESAKGSDSSTVISSDTGLYIADEEWHIVVVDLSKACSTYTPEADGTYIAKYLRLDTTQGHSTYKNKNIYTDIAYVGITDDLKQAVTLDDSIENVLVYDGKVTVYDSSTGEATDKVIDGSSTGSSNNPDQSTEDVINVELDKLSVGLSPSQIVGAANGFFYSAAAVKTESGIQYAHLVPAFGGEAHSESYSTFYSYDKESPTISGQYLIIKYRTNAAENPFIEIFTSTTNESANASDCIHALSLETGLYLPDGKWHIVVLDLSKCSTTYVTNENGEYVMTYLRLDTTQGHLQFTSSNVYTDIAYIGVTGDLTTAITLDTSIEDILFYDGNAKVYSSSTGEATDKPLPKPDTSGTTEDEPLFDPSDKSLEAVLSRTSFLYDRGDYTEIFQNKLSLAITEDGLKYTNPDGDDGYFVLFSGNVQKKTGKYFFMRYRASENVALTIFTATDSSGPAANRFAGVEIENDGEWHTLIIDVSTIIHFPASGDGSYTAQHLRLDVDGVGEWIEIACLGYALDYEDATVITTMFDGKESY